MAKKLNCHSTAKTLLFMNHAKITFVHPVINAQLTCKVGLSSLIHAVYSPMLGQLSYEVKSVRARCDISELSAVPSISVCFYL